MLLELILGVSKIKKMVEQIKDNWEKLSLEEFTLRRALLTDHVVYAQAQNIAISEKVTTNKLIKVIIVQKHLIVVH